MPINKAMRTFKYKENKQNQESILNQKYQESLQQAIP